MRSRLLVAAAAAAALAACSTGATKVTMTVQSWTPEDAHHVAVVARFTNTGSSAGTAICTIAAYDSGGTIVGQDTDGPADKIAPGKSANIRVLVKTSVDTSVVADVRQMPGVSCA